MENRRYALVIMDSTGRRMRRFNLAHGPLKAAKGLAIGSCLLLLAALIHGAMIYRTAVETARISAENRELKKVIKHVESQLPEARSVFLHTELSFGQLWAKSGLGVEPRLLSVGPLEAGASAEDTMLQTMAPFSSYDLVSDEPLSLPFEVSRLEDAGLTLQYSLGETLEYFHDADLLLANTPSIRPATTPWLTSSFGKRRDPIYNYWVMHKGLDMGGHLGMEIRAPADGVVIWAGRRGGYGMTVVLDHGYGIQTHFAHLSRYLVQLGDHIRRGDPIARMGSTGKSTGPHLHYEVRRNGEPMDPRRFILD